MLVNHKSLVFAALERVNSVNIAKYAIMKTNTFSSLATAALVSCATAAADHQSSLSFGCHYAVLNLDLINGLVGGVEGTPAGEKWIRNTADWIDT